MQKVNLLLILLSASHFGFSQQPYKTTYEQLKEYEGLYEYTNQTTLKIAASPKDTSLYAIINESKYRLIPSDTDLFLNMSKEKKIKEHVLMNFNKKKLLPVE